MTTTTKSSAIQVGDKVQYNGTFLRGAHSAMMLAKMVGVVLSIQSLGALTLAEVEWSGASDLTKNRTAKINVTKIKKVK